ncbi:dTMP kinase [Paenibacillus dendritiformis]|uniref:dTMP kinase n=1 Tax=Paenibacillus dendritiformis TaxID=130049 RepID=UPI00387E0E0B
MFIVAIEGLDKAGKFTQVNLLTQKLRNEGYRVQVSEFHRYDTPTGSLIMKWLKKEWEASQSTIEMIMTADKQNQQEWFQMLEQQEYDLLILDRYILSQAAYAVANGVDGKWLLDLQRYMRKPDLDIVIDIPPEESIRRKGKYGENDRYEEDKNLLEKVRENYLSFSTDYSAPIKKVVNGFRDVNDIHDVIYEIVKNFLEGERNG